jgi:hypothetical protein
MLHFMTKEQRHKVVSFVHSLQDRLYKAGAMKGAWEHGYALELEWQPGPISIAQLQAVIKELNAFEL